MTYETAIMIVVRDSETNEILQKVNHVKFRQYLEMGRLPSEGFLDDLVARYNLDQKNQSKRMGLSSYQKASIELG